MRRHVVKRYVRSRVGPELWSSESQGTCLQLLASGYGDGKCWLSDPAWMTLWRAQGQGWRSQNQIAEHYRQFLAQERP